MSDTNLNLKLITRTLPAILLPVLFLVTLWQTAQWAEKSALSRLQETSGHSLRLYVANIRGELGKYERLPELLSTNRLIMGLLATPSRPQSLDEVNLYLEHISQVVGASDVYLMDDKGLTIAASNWRKKRTFIGKNFSYRPYFQQAIAGQVGRYFALGTTSNQRGYYFSYPVILRSNIEGVIVVKVTLASIESAWSGDKEEFVVTDPDGVVFITTRPEWKFRSLVPLPENLLESIRESRRYGANNLLPLPQVSEYFVDESYRIVRIQNLSELHNERRQPIGTRATSYLMQRLEMPEAGWSVHVLTKLDQVNAQVFRAMILVAVVFALLVLMILFVQQRRRRVQERRRYEQEAQHELEVNEARIRAIIDNTHAGLVTVDSDCMVDSFNPTASWMFGYQQDEIGALNFMQLIHPEDREQLPNKWGTFSGQNPAGSDEQHIEVRGLRKDQTSFPIELTLGEMTLREGDRYIATIHDISELKETERALRQTRDELEVRVEARTADLNKTNRKLLTEIDERQRAEEVLKQTQHELIQAAKLAGLGEMSAGISHELNQPLTAIRTYSDNAQILIDHERVDEASWNLEQISELTTRMADIISQLRIFARKSAGQAAPVSFVAVLDRSLKLLAQQIRVADLDVRVDLPKDEEMVMADMVRLEQVVVNLITNAIDALLTSKNKLLEITQVIDEEYVILRFSDNGSGISDGHIGEIFDPFFTTKEVGQGLGLGLSISYRIIEGFGGRLRAYNRAEGGAVFEIQLRKAQTAGEESDDAIASSHIG